MARIIVGSDVCPTASDQDAFLRGDSRALLNNMQDEFLSADLRIVNLECPLVDCLSPIAKSGPALSAPSGCVNGLRAMGVEVVALANNHILDQGSDGITTTIARCTDAGMTTVGAGRNLAEATKWLSIEVKGLRVGIVAVAEHEWSIATEISPGAAPVDPIRLSREMAERRAEYDFIVVIVHGGIEHFPYPTPWLQDVCRFLVEQGADAVVCQHTHCPGCTEAYLGKHIVYGQGNMIFDWTGKVTPWFQGFLCAFEADRNKPLKMEIMPYWQSAGQVGIRHMAPEEGSQLLAEILHRSEVVADAASMRDEWMKFCKEKRQAYMGMALGTSTNPLYNNRLARLLNRRGGLERAIWPDSALLALTDIIRCESHREALLEVLEQEVQNRTAARRMPVEPGRKKG